MSFVFRGSRADIESGGFPLFVPEHRAMRIHAGGSPNSSLAFLVTVLILFMIWLFLGVFLAATSLRMYATCQQLQAQAQDHAAATSGFHGHAEAELRVHVPPTIALDYEALRALDSDNSPHAHSMSEEEISALPVFKYKAQAQQGSVSFRESDGSSQMSASSTGSGNEKKQDGFMPDGTSKTLEDELMCSICLEQVDVGDLLRSLPCFHQFHVNCIDPWLRQQGTCPVCKHEVNDGW